MTILSLDVLDASHARTRLRPGRYRGQCGQIAGAEPPVALDHHRHAGGLGVVVHLVPSASAATAATASTATATTSAGRLGPHAHAPVVRAAVIGGHRWVPPPPGRRFLVTAAVPHLPAYTGYVPPEVGVEPAVQ